MVKRAVLGTAALAPTVKRPPPLAAALARSSSAMRPPSWKILGMVNATPGIAEELPRRAEAGACVDGRLDLDDGS
jgi:hypothetical protein